jgi:Fe-S cluster assembly protein SufD
MTGLAAVTDRYLADFEALDRRGSSPAWLARLRREAMARFTDLGFPTVRLEEWKYTNVAPIAAIPFRPALDEDGDGVPAEAIERLTAPGPRLVFVNGRYAARLSSPGPLPRGARVSSLAEALGADAPSVERHLARHAAADADGFAALSTAFIQDGAVVHLGPGVRLREPVQLLFVATGSAPPVLAQPRILVVAEPGSEGTVIERWVGLGEGSSLTNAVAEIAVAEGAAVSHYKIEQESERAYHVGTTHVSQGRDSRYVSCSVAIGGALARNTLSVRFEAEGGSCSLDGLYVVHGGQHVDNHTLIDHARPGCTSRQLYKGVLDGRSRAVFNGRVLVRPDAQRTDAHQTNKNLLLSEDAEVDTKPQLEIFADDVRCTHGAAVGQLGEDAVFYLRSRGFGEAAARVLLTHGFMTDVLNRITVEPIRDQLDRLLLARLRARAAEEPR